MLQIVTIFAIYFQIFFHSELCYSAIKISLEDSFTNFSIKLNYYFSVSFIKLLQSL